MTALSERLAEIRAEDRPALVGYLPVGFPSVEGSIRAIEAMVESGVDVVEVGLPYSDPVMDGPVVEAAVDRALAAGARVSDVFDVVAASVGAGAPTVVMTYWNPIERYGVDRFAQDLAKAGGSGLITPDLIPDEAQEWTSAARAHDLDQVFLVAPSSSDARLAMTGRVASGFVYAASVMGVTGVRDRASDRAPELVRRLREVTDLPVGVGLGVRDGDQAAEVGAYADAVIVGSALVRRLLDAEDDLERGIAGVRELASDLRAGVERARQ